MTDAQMKSALHRLSKSGSAILDDDQFKLLVECLGRDPRLGRVSLHEREPLMSWFQETHGIEAERWSLEEFPEQEVLDLLFPQHGDQGRLLVRVLDQDMVALYTGMYTDMDDVRRHRALARVADQDNAWHAPGARSVIEEPK